MDKIAAVVPVYGSPNSLTELTRRLVETLSGLTDDFEILLIDDFCPRNSWEIIEQLCAEYKSVKGIRFSKNFGQHYAILAGLRKTDADFVVVMDCDLQDQPEDIAKLYAKAKEGYDKVFVKRVNRKSSFMEKLTSMLFYRVLTYMTDTEQDESVGNFGIYSKKVIEEIANLSEIARLFPVHARWVGFSEASVEIEHNSRFEGSSSYTFRKRMALAINIAMSFSDKPLWLVVKFGFFISSLSVVYALYTFVQWFLGNTLVEGWTSIVISIWLLSGVIIALIGFVGAYVAKTFDETKQRPLFIIDKELNTED